jgi:hypothetical protein
LTKGHALEDPVDTLNNEPASATRLGILGTCECWWDDNSEEKEKEQERKSSIPRCEDHCWVYSARQR